MQIMRNKLGVMQGRLLPKYNKRYQAHPVDSWQDEFLIAKHFGLDCIEFILDYNDAEKNPLLKDGGIDEIKKIVDQTDVTVFTICADYFMEAPLHSKDQNIAKQSLVILTKLLNNAFQLNVTDVVIPCVDQSSLSDQSTADLFVKQLTSTVELAEKYSINLSLETDLDPTSFVELLDRFDSMHVTVNYDIGNSASLGYNPVEELETYGDRITDIHIKDRVLNGGSVVLGRGNADFDLFFRKLNEFDYNGPFIIQAYRDEEGLKIFKEQKDWIQQYLN
jgi:L-ribulose-5-phosphate 3-epimerase